MHLGDLQQLTMLAVIRLRNDAYGANIRRQLKEVARRNASISTIYVTLIRLEEQGLVKSEYGDTAARGGPRRRLFRVTPKGMRALRSARAATERMWDGIEPSHGL